MFFDMYNSYLVNIITNQTNENHKITIILLLIIN